MKTIKELMTKDVITVTTQDNVYEIALKMRDNDIGFVPVVDGKRIIGVVTDRDLVVRGYAEKNSGSTSVEEVMTKEIISCKPDTTVDEAAQIMASKQIRRLAVIENDQLVGVVAIGDLAVRDKTKDEAGQALSQISEQDKVPVGSAT